MIDFKRLKDSFKFAFSGLKTVFKEEQCFRIELIFAAIASVASFYFPLASEERAIVLILTALVLGSEILNSIIERIMNALYPSFDEKAGKIKDLGGALVLVLSLASAAIGIAIFLPYLTEIF